MTTYTHMLEWLVQALGDRQCWSIASCCEQSLICSRKAVQRTAQDCLQEVCLASYLSAITICRSGCFAVQQAHRRAEEGEGEGVKPAAGLSSLLPRGLLGDHVSHKAVGSSLAIRLVQGIRLHHCHLCTSQNGACQQQYDCAV